MDGSSPGSSFHRISQARILEQLVISSYRGSSWSRDQTCIFWVSYIGRQILYHYKALFWISAKIFVQEVFRKTDLLLLLDHHSLCLWSTLEYVYGC